MTVSCTQKPSILVYVFFLCFFSVLACGQQDGEGIEEELRANFEMVFQEDSIAAISFGPQGGFSSMVDAYLTRGQLNYHRSSFSFNEHELPTIGFRIKGQVEEGEGREEKKYSLKTNFDYFGQERFLLIDKMHFENSKPDPSLMREALANKFFRALGLPAPLSSFAWVKADGKDLGIYTIIQEIDRRMLTEYFGQENRADRGNLYSCVAPFCTFQWRGESKASYWTRACLEEDGCGWVLETNTKDPVSNSYQDLIQLIRLVNQASDEEFQETLEEILDVENLLRMLAASALIGNYEGFLGGMDEFYIYRRPDTGRFVFISWDHDRTMGRSTCSNKVIPQDIMKPWCPGQRPLLERVLGVERWAAFYKAQIRDILDSHFNEEVFGQWIQQYASLLKDKVSKDKNLVWDEATWQISLGHQPTAGNAPGLLFWVKTRAAWASDSLTQMEGNQ